MRAFGDAICVDTVTREHRSQIFSNSNKYPTYISTTNPVCARRVNFVVCSLPLHRHSYIGFILAFALSIHNTQTYMLRRVTRTRIPTDCSSTVTETMEKKVVRTRD